MKRIVYGEDMVCPSCGAMLAMNVDVGSKYLYDVCTDCGFKRKKRVDGRAEEVEQESG